METCEQQTFPFSEDESMFCPLAFPASRLPWPGSAEALEMTVGSGAQCSMLLDSASPLGRFSRILLASSHWTSSEEYCYVWERLDTQFGLSAFQLTPLGQSTNGNGCSLLPTPRKEGYDTQGKGHGDLVYEVKNRLFPTPTNSMMTENDLVQAQYHSSKRPKYAEAKLWPTPRHDHSGLESHGVTHLGGSLNPRFVCELMGFEVDHTNLKRWETLSSRSKRSLSSKRLPR